MTRSLVAEMTILAPVGERMDLRVPVLRPVRRSEHKRVVGTRVANGDFRAAPAHPHTQFGGHRGQEGTARATHLLTYVVTVDHEPGGEHLGENHETGPVARGLAHERGERGMGDLRPCPGRPTRRRSVFLEPILEWFTLQILHRPVCQLMDA